MPKYKAILLSAALTMGLPTLTLAQSEPTEATPDAAPMMDVTADTVLATVGDTVITLGNVIAAVSNLEPQQQQLPSQDILLGLTERMIQQAAIAATQDTVSKATELTVANHRRGLIAAEAVAAIAATIEVTDEEMQAAYDLRFKDFTPAPEFNASHILVETEDEAKALVTELEAGADFAETATAKSTGPSGPNGGSLGWFARGQMVEPFQEALEKLEVGAISGPVQTQFGWHVVKLNETRVPAVPTMDEVSDEIRAEVFRSKMNSAIVAIIDGTEIERTDLSTFNAEVVRDGSLIGQ